MPEQYFIVPDLEMDLNTESIHRKIMNQWIENRMLTHYPIFQYKSCDTHQKKSLS